MADPTPTKVLLTTTFRPLVMDLSGSLAQGARLVARFLEQGPNPEKTARFECDLRTLLREVGRRIMAWVLNHLEPERDEEGPSLLRFEDRRYRRRRRYRRSIATLFGSVEVWRRLYEPLGGGGRSMHSLEIRVGIEAGLATPALAERVGRWSTDHTQRQALTMLEEDHGVRWSCTSLRKVLWALQAGMAPHRNRAQVAQVVTWLEQARASHGRYRPTLSVGRDGIFVPLRHGVWQEGATATLSVLDRRGSRLGTVYLGQMPESGQGTLTTQLSALLSDILSQVESQSLRLVYVTDEGYHPSDYYHRVLKTMGRSASPLARFAVETDCRLLPCVPVCSTARRGHLWGRSGSAAVGQADASRVENTRGRGESGVEIGVGPTAGAGRVWDGQSVHASLWLPQKTQPVDAVSPLSAPEITDRLRYYGGYLTIVPLYRQLLPILLLGSRDY